MSVRAATAADLPAIAGVARACGLEEPESGADPDYASHLLRHGRLLVARSDSAGSRGSAVAGFGATVPVGTLTMVADLFVVPELRSAGLGRELLDALLGDAAAACTFSSADPRARALYRAHGMRAAWTLAYLTGRAPAAPPAGWDVEPADPAAAAAAEAELTGLDRADAYRYWCARPGGRAFLLRHGGRTAGAGARLPGVELTHLAVAPGSPEADAVAAGLAGQGAQVSVHVPQDSAAAQRLGQLGFTRTESDLFHTTGPDPRDRGVLAFAPGLC